MCAGAFLRVHALYKRELVELIKRPCVWTQSFILVMGPGCHLTHGRVGECSLRLFLSLQVYVIPTYAGEKNACKLVSC